MKLSKDDKQLKNALLNEVNGNVKTLMGDWHTYVDGEPVSDLALIDESIKDLTQVAELLKEGND